MQENEVVKIMLSEFWTSLPSLYMYVCVCVCVFSCGEVLCGVCVCSCVRACFTYFTMKVDKDAEGARPLPPLPF